MAVENESVSNCKAGFLRIKEPAYMRFVVKKGFEKIKTLEHQSHMLKNGSQIKQNNVLVTCFEYLLHHSLAQIHLFYNKYRSLSSVLITDDSTITSFSVLFYLCVAYRKV